MNLKDHTIPELDRMILAELVRLKWHATKSKSRQRLRRDYLRLIDMLINEEIAAGSV